jgi:hypothetical protein
LDGVYLLVIPAVLIVLAVGWLFYIRVAYDKDSDLRTGRKSPLEEAQEMEREEVRQSGHQTS